MSSFIKVQHAVTENIQRTGIEKQFDNNFYLTSLFFSQLAYLKLARVEKTLVDSGADEYSIYDRAGTQGLFAKFGRTAVISFRGTETNKTDDLKTIFAFWRRKYNNIKIHAGFYNSLSGVIDLVNEDLERVSNECDRVVYTGHSMGGALCTLLAYHRAPTDLCTFGEPRISGGKQFIESMVGINYHRVVTKHDWIRYLPFAIPKILPYEHAGIERLLPSSWNWKNWVEPHALSTYSQLIISEDLR